jgi:predicted small secreted protein
VIDAAGAKRWHGACERFTPTPRKPASHSTDKETVMTRLLALLAAAAVASMLTACNTVEGAGKDVKATGQAVENAADKAKPSHN